MRRIRRFALIGFIALLVVLPLHEIVDPGEQLPFDDEVVAVLFSALFIVAASLTSRLWSRELFMLVKAVARLRLRMNTTATHVIFPTITTPGDKSLVHLVLCQFRV